MSRFIAPPGETIFAVGANYPLKVAAFDLDLPGCIYPDADNNPLKVQFPTNQSAIPGVNARIGD